MSETSPLLPKVLGEEAKLGVAGEKPIEYAFVGLSKEPKVPVKEAELWAPPTLRVWLLLSPVKFTLPVTLAVIVVTPGASKVISPLGFTVATAGLEL